MNYNYIIYLYIYFEYEIFGNKKEYYLYVLYFCFIYFLPYYNLLFFINGSF